jgi:hypothetical protein
LSQNEIQAKSATYELNVFSLVHADLTVNYQVVDFARIPFLPNPEFWHKLRPTDPIIPQSWQPWVEGEGSENSFFARLQGFPKTVRQR